MRVSGDAAETLEANRSLIERRLQITTQSPSPCVSELHELLRQAEALEVAHIEDVSSWVLLLAHGYLKIATLSRDFVRLNAEKKAGELFREAMARSHASSQPGIFDLACLIANHHYEAAVVFNGEDGALEDARTTETRNRKVLYHTSEAVRHGEHALEYSDAQIMCNSLESTIEIRTMVHHARVIQADCMVTAGRFVDASRILGMLPDWSKASEHVIWYVEELLARMRLALGMAVASKLEGCLREIAGLLRSTSLEAYGTKDREMLSKRLGRILGKMMRQFSCGGGVVEGHASVSSLMDAVVFVFEAAPDVGVDALLVVVEQLAHDLENQVDEYLWADILCDIMLMGNVCRLVRARGQEVSADLVGVFQTAAGRAFVVGGVDISIKFSQVVLQYDLESRRNWDHAMLYSLHVYKACVLMGGEFTDGIEQSYAMLDDSTKAHPFIMTTRLLELKERNHRNDQNENADAARSTSELAEAIASAATTDPRTWTKDYLLALQEIDGSIEVTRTVSAEHKESSVDGALDRFLRTELIGQDLQCLIAGVEAAAADAERQLKVLHGLRGVKRPGMSANLLRKVLTALQVTIASTLEHKDSDWVIESNDKVLGLVRTGLALANYGENANGETRSVLKSVCYQLLVLTCNTQMDALLQEATRGKGVSAGTRSLCKARIDAVRATIEELLEEGHAQDPSSVLLVFRYALLSGDLLTACDLDAILQLMGEEYFLEFFSIHIGFSHIGVDLLHMLQYIVDNIPRGLEAILVSVALGGSPVGARTAYKIYATATRNLSNVPPTIGEVIMATNETAPYLAAKVGHLEPWKYGGYICDWNEEDHDDSGETRQSTESGDGVDADEIEDLTSRSLMSPSLSQDEIESPPTAVRKRKLSTAELVISGLIQDLAPSSNDSRLVQGFQGDTRLEEGGGTPWIKWIKRVFSP